MSKFSIIIAVTVVTLLAFACRGGQPARTSTPTATPTPGQNRFLPPGLTQQQCYELGQTDAARDKAAGATLYKKITDVLIGTRGQTDAPSFRCAEAYSNGYEGKPFQQH